MNIFMKIGLWIERWKAKRNQNNLQLIQDMTLLKMRMDKVELYIGLRRDPSPLVVPGASRIS